MSQPALSINLPFLYRCERQILGQICLDLEAGKWTCLLGPSGTGKTSLLRCIAGLENLDGYTAPPLSYMTQQDLLLPWLTVLANVTLGYALRDEVSDARLALEVLAQVGLKNAAALYPAQLSAGMRQRVALARTIFENRPFILLDEPFSALDVATRRGLQAYANAALQGKTVLFVTHDLSEALRLADVIYMLRGSPAQLTRLEALPQEPPPRDLTSQSLWRHYEALSQKFFE